MYLPASSLGFASLSMPTSVSNLVAVHVVPLLKDKVKNPVPSSNCRPIAIASALSKVNEKTVLHCLEAYLNMLNNKFSYKKWHGTEVCVCGR